MPTTCKLTFCSFAAACLAAKRLPPANTTLPAFCLGAAAAGAAPLLDEGRPGAAPPAVLDPEAACTVLMSRRGWYTLRLYVDLVI